MKLTAESSSRTFALLLSRLHRFLNPKQVAAKICVVKNALDYFDGTCQFG